MADVFISLSHWIILRLLTRSHIFQSANIVLKGKLTRRFCFVYCFVVFVTRKWKIFINIFRWVSHFFSLFLLHLNTFKSYDTFTFFLYIHTLHRRAAYEYLSNRKAADGKKKKRSQFFCCTVSCIIQWKDKYARKLFPLFFKPFCFKDCLLFCFKAFLLLLQLFALVGTWRQRTNS